MRRRQFFVRVILAVIRATQNPKPKIYVRNATFYKNSLQWETFRWTIFLASLLREFGENKERHVIKPFVDNDTACLVGTIKINDSNLFDPV